MPEKNADALSFDDMVSHIGNCVDLLKASYEEALTEWLEAKSSFLDAAVQWARQGGMGEPPVEPEPTLLEQVIDEKTRNKLSHYYGNMSSSIVSSLMLYKHAKDNNNVDLIKRSMELMVSVAVSDGENNLLEPTRYWCDEIMNVLQSADVPPEHLGDAGKAVQGLEAVIENIDALAEAVQSLSEAMDNKHAVGRSIER